MINEGHMDDIMVFSTDTKEHRDIIKCMLAILCWNNLYLKPEKCKFERESGIFGAGGEQGEGRDGGSGGGGCEEMASSWNKEQVAAVPRFHQLLLEVHPSFCKHFQAIALPDREKCMGLGIGATGQLQNSQVGSNGSTNSG